MAGALEQFNIAPVGGLPSIQVGGYDLSFTNSAAAMTVAVVLSCGLMLAAGRRRAMIPGRMQSLGEILYNFVSGMVRDNAGSHAKPYFPVIFSVFMFVLFGNLLGMIPGSFTFTSHIIVTFSLAAFVFVFVTILGFVLHGLHFFHLLLPPGVPGFLAPVMVVVEFISYMARPVSLSVRLFANMLAGHILLKVFAGFVVSLGALEALSGFGYVVGVLPLAMIVALTALEFFVALLQAYIFALLACIYLHDALEMH